MGNEPSFVTREYRPEDWPMVVEWWVHHTQQRTIIEGLLPPIGVIAEQDGQPVAACWVHLSVSVGVAFLESPVTRPGSPLRTTMGAMGAVLGALEAICRAHDYSVVIANTLPGIARYLTRRHGFVAAGERIQLLKLL